MRIIFVVAARGGDREEGLAVADQVVEVLLHEVRCGCVIVPDLISFALALVMGVAGERLQRHELGGDAGDRLVAAGLVAARFVGVLADDEAPLAGRAPILQAWTARTGDLYGAVPAGAPPGAMREPPRTTDVFGILGGRAALRETLQLELLPGRRSPRRFRWPRSGASR